MQNGTACFVKLLQINFYLIYIWLKTVLLLPDASLEILHNMLCTINLSYYFIETVILTCKYSSFQSFKFVRMVLLKANLVILMWLSMPATRDYMDYLNGGYETE